MNCLNGVDGMPCFNECYITIILRIMKHIKFITFFLSIACLFIACKNTADNDREGTSPAPEMILLPKALTSVGLRKWKRPDIASIMPTASSLNALL